MAKLPPSLPWPSDGGGGGDMASATVLDMVLEAAVKGAAEAKGGKPRAGLRGAKSASPRPQRWRPVDAVRLAKQEVTQETQRTVPKLVKTGKSASAIQDSTASVPECQSQLCVPMASLHEGFFDFAAAVVRPQPTAREHAEGLRERLDSALNALMASGSKSPSGGATGGKGAAKQPQWTVVEGSIQSQKEVGLCFDVLEQYVKETSTDSKERCGFLERVREAAADALSRLVASIRRCVNEIEAVEERRGVLEGSVDELSKDNAGLRRMLQQMLGKEAELESKTGDLQQEADSLQQQLDAAGAKIRDLAAQLEATVAELQELQDETARGKPTCDACSSPMMGFSNFVLSPDKVPQAISSDNAESGMYWGRVDSIKTLSGFEKVGRRKTLSTGNDAAGGNMLVPQHRASVRLSTSSSVSVEKEQRRRASRSGMNTPVAHPGYDDGSGSDRPVPAHRMTIVDGVSGFSPTDDADNISRASRASIIASDMAAEVVPEPSVLATSFPALMPFVDFSLLDPELERSTADTMALNQEHLEKHLVICQEDFQRELAHNEELQNSLDTCLEKVLVWVKAIHDSLQDLASTAVQQHVQSLSVFRDAVEWLAKHPCKEWTSPPGQLDDVLESHETQLRAHLASDRQDDTEVEDLKAAVSQQRLRIQELSDQLLEARSSVASVSRPQRRAPTTSAPGVGRRVSASVPSAPLVRHTSVQCTLGTEDHHPMAPTLAEASGEGACAVIDPDDEVANIPITQALSRAEARADAAEVSNDSTMIEDSGAVDAAVVAAEPAGGLATGAGGPAPCDAAMALTDQEASRMRLLRSPFVEAIDLTAIPAVSRVLLDPSANSARGATGEPSVRHLPGDHDDGALSLKQLHVLIAEVYSAKKADDQHRDKVHKERRPMHLVLQDHMRRQHGVKRVVHQKSWQLVESLLLHSKADRSVRMFTEFLDSSREVDELSFHLYCSSVLSIAVAQESQALPPARLPDCMVSFERAMHMIELMFGDLKKVMDVTCAELKKCMVTQPPPTSLGSIDMLDTETSTAIPVQIVMVADLHEILLEGWRMAALLLDQSVTSFSWRRCVRAFVLGDACHRGWLDQHEVRRVEGMHLDFPGAREPEGLKLLDRTSLGALAFRAVHRCSGAQAPTAAEPGNAKVVASNSLSSALSIAEKKKARKTAEACLHVSRNAFDSVEKTLGVYLTWMMHSEELRDLAACRSVRAQLYGFRQASTSGHSSQGAHHFRSLLLLLLAHQFDVQFQHGDLSAEHLDWEFRTLIRVLRESWKRGAEAAGDRGPGPELLQLAGEEEKEGDGD